MFAYISENHPFYNLKKIDIDNLDNKDIWFLDEGNCFQNQVISICRINYQVQTSQNLIYRSNSIESLRRIVENKNGITFIPELATINIPSELEDLVKEISGTPPVREISLVTPKNYSKERQVAALKEIILKSVPRRMLATPESWLVFDSNLKIK